LAKAPPLGKLINVILPLAPNGFCELGYFRDEEVPLGRPTRL
jgi:hypothetical protein